MDSILRGTLISEHPDSIKLALINRFRELIETQTVSNDVLENVLKISANFIVQPSHHSLLDSVLAVYIVAIKKSPQASMSAINPQMIKEFMCSTTVIGRSVTNILSHVIPAYQTNSETYNKLSETVSESLLPFITYQQTQDHMSVNQLLIICLQNPKFLPRSSTSVCYRLLRFLANLKLSMFGENPAEYVVVVETIADVVEALWRVSDFDSLRQTIVLIFSFVADDSNPNEPYLPLAAVVKHIRLEYLNQCVRELVDIYEGDEKAIKIILHRLTNFLRWPKSTNLDAWILMLILGLAERGKAVLILEYIRDYVVFVIQLLSMRGIARQSVTTLLEFMLLAYQHNHDLVELVAKELPAVCEALKKENSPSSNQCLCSLAEVGHILACMHKIDVRTMPRPVVELLEQYPAPPRETMLKRIRAHKWSNVAKRSSSDLTKQVKRRSETGCVGLLNVGNTCYANAALQLLYNCPEFRKAVLNGSPAGRSPVGSQLYSLFSSLDNSKMVVSDPGNFVKSTRPSHFIPGEQQDAAEYLGHLLDQLHEQEQGSNKLVGVSSTTASDVPVPMETGENTQDISAPVMTTTSNTTTTLVQSLFRGSLDHHTACRGCQHKSRRQENFYFLFLPLSTPLEEAAHVVPESSATEPSTPAPAVTAKSTSPPIPVEDVGRLVKHLLSTVEEIPDSASCEACGRQEGTRRSLTLNRLPPYVLICLNLFTFNRATNSCTKLLRRVKVPEFLPVVPMKAEEECCNPATAPVTGYTLQGMIVHHGVSMTFGHYTTVCRVGVNWVWFDDDTARFTQLEQIGAEASSTPYLLVYSRN